MNEDHQASYRSTKTLTQTKKVLLAGDTISRKKKNQNRLLCLSLVVNIM